MALRRAALGGILLSQTDRRVVMTALACHWLLQAFALAHRLLHGCCAQGDGSVLSTLWTYRTSRLAATSSRSFSTASKKIVKFKVFLDLFCVNAFHQVRLGPTTSERLSEGVTPASFILQEKYSGTSTDEWTIAVFDILLVLADSYEDAKNHH